MRASVCLRTSGCESFILAASFPKCGSTSSVYCMHMSDSTSKMLLRTAGSVLEDSWETMRGTVARHRGSSTRDSLPSAAQACACSGCGTASAAPPSLHRQTRHFVSQVSGRVRAVRAVVCVPGRPSTAQSDRRWRRTTRRQRGASTAPRARTPLLPNAAPTSEHHSGMLQWLPHHQQAAHSQLDTRGCRDTARRHTRRATNESGSTPRREVRRQRRGHLLQLGRRGEGLHEHDNVVRRQLATLESRRADGEERHRCLVHDAVELRHCQACTCAVEVSYNEGIDQKHAVELRHWQACTGAAPLAGAVGGAAVESESRKCCCGIGIPEVGSAVEGATAEPAGKCHSETTTW